MVLVVVNNCYAILVEIESKKANNYHYQYYNHNHPFCKEALGKWDLIYMHKVGSNDVHVGA